MAPSTTSWSFWTASMPTRCSAASGQPHPSGPSTCCAVCHSLSEAQSCGLVHRDIKAANIFICRYGEEFDFVKVLDFGIVRAVRGAPEPGEVHTRENAIQGTPAFIAPEQAMGTALDARADIYATGCLAYWFLTGQFVFTSDTSMGMLLQHAQTAPV